jgi:hypothetical protein
MPSASPITPPPMPSYYCHNWDSQDKSDLSVGDTQQDVCQNDRWVYGNGGAGVRCPTMIMMTLDQR